MDVAHNAAEDTFECQGGISEQEKVGKLVNRIRVKLYFANRFPRAKSTVTRDASHVAGSTKK